MKAVLKGIDLGKQVTRSILLPRVFYPVARCFSNKYLSVSEEQARETLMTFSPRPTGFIRTQNTLKDSPMYDLQIIIPAFNEEKHLCECIDSVLNQKTQYSFLIVLIDDGSSDRTAEIADSYVSDRMKVIHQSNKGFSGARNTGLSFIDARYIMFVDSDDRMPDGAIEALMKVADEYDADIVQGGYYRQVGDQLCEAKRFVQKKCSNVAELYGQPWGKVYRRNLWENLCFPEGYWFEDTILSFLVYTQAKEVWLVDEMVYIYRDNSKGITKTASKKVKCVDTYWVTEKVMEEYALLELPLNERYLRRFCRQVVVNAHRIRNMPVEVKQAIFVLMCGLYARYLGDFETDEQYAHLQEALKERNFGQYQLYTQLKRW